jgi:predicted site-specific integrase-resolvase
VTLGVNSKTVRTWAKRGVIAAACVVGDRRLRVWFPEVAEMVDRRSKHRRSA